MNGVHDLGGVDGFGPVEIAADEAVFHARWERRVFGMVVALSAQQLVNVHAFRHAIERMEPLHYLASPYYEHWLTAAATLLVEQGVLTREELDAAGAGKFPRARPVRAEAGTDVVDTDAALPRFAVGSTVLVRNVHPHGHTRCPRYVRGKRGTVVRIDGAYPLPDVAAHTGERRSRCTYSVRFEARELWGEAAATGETVHVDLWESYLEAP